MAAISRIFSASLLLYLLLLIIIADSKQMVGLSGPVATPVAASGAAPAEAINCTASCDVRCSETKRPNLCKRACGSCCARCNCVPPGTYGNYEACPCYFNLRTHNNNRKCP